MTEVLQIGSWIGSTLGGVVILAHFFRFIFRRGASIRVSSPGFYLPSLILLVSVVYALTTSHGNKQIREMHTLYYEEVVEPYLSMVVRNIIELRDDNGITKHVIGDTAGKTEYPVEISTKCEQLKELENKGIRLTPESYYELGLFAYYREEYDEAIRFGKSAISLRMYYSDAWYLVSGSYLCMDQLDSARYYYQKYDTIKRRQQDKIPFP